VNVIGNAANGEGFHTIRLCHATDERPRTLLHLRHDKFASLFCAEDTVPQITQVRMRHRCFNRPGETQNVFPAFFTRR
jgi:hypothetical protein